LIYGYNINEFIVNLPLIKKKKLIVSGNTNKEYFDPNYKGGWSGKHSLYVLRGCLASQWSFSWAFILVEVKFALQITQTVPLFDSVRSLIPCAPPPPFPSAACFFWFLSLDMNDFNPFPPPI
jgi:hypothetical protein